MLKTEQKKIGEHTYRATQLPGTKALRTFTQISKMIGPAIGALAKDGDAVSNLLDQKVENLGGALAVLADELDPDRVEALVRTFAESSQIQHGGGWLELGNSEIFDQTFGGAVDELFAWLGFCLQLNYSSFLGAGRKALGRASGEGKPEK